jgi:hypothetical protein
MRLRRLAPIVALASLLAGCYSISVKKLDPSDPGGMPFYLTKPVKQTTTTTFTLTRIADAQGTTLAEPKVVATHKIVEVAVIEVLDRSQAYTLNKFKAFAGESKFKFERPTQASTSAISKAEVEDKEGITEFFKGLVEGAKTLTELAREGAKATAGKPAGLMTEDESGVVTALLNKGYLLLKTVDVTLTDL